MRKIAIIPARGGSKRIPKKNIKLFHDKPIIAYSIELAIKSELFDFVYVSTDDAEIEFISHRFGAKVHKRSDKNSDDFATTSDVIQEVLMDLESIHGNIDLICCIYATTPLLEVADLMAAHRTFQESESDVVLAATPFSFPPQRGFTVINHEINLVNPDKIQSRSQDLTTQYHDVGAFYFINPTKFKISKNIWAGKMHAHILPESKIQDIDTEEDWKMAELKYELLISEQNDNASFNEWTTKNYKCLTKQVYSKNEFKIVPIRSTDRHEIRKWRNEQVYHLRQSGLLSEKEQDAYYQNVVSKLFEEEKPNQLLFSFLQNNVCIGYGGLVHINWIDRHAEISFIMDTALEKAYFQVNWLTYLSLIEQVAFDNLNFHKIYTYAFDLRPHLYEALLASNFSEAARLKEHCLFNDQFIDVVIHHKIRVR